MIKVFVI